MAAGIVFLMGPTASGKTALVEFIHSRFPCTVISVDSTAVYRGMDIGSAKPDAALQERVPHQLIDIRDPDQSYSAADFIVDASNSISASLAAGRTAVLVGGTMLYYKALRDGLAELPAADATVRADIERLAREHGWEEVHAELARVDPVAAERIHPNDPQRLQRALEVYRLSGEPLSALQARNTGLGGNLPRQPLQLCLRPDDRALLHARIEQRFEQMLAQGLEGEVRRLLAQGYSADLPALRAVGYRQMVQYLRGELDYAAMRERGIIASRQLAKRQLTWLRSWPDLHSLLATEQDYNCLFLEPAKPAQRSIIQQLEQRLCNYLDSLSA